jgi:hypothetical protein
MIAVSDRLLRAIALHIGPLSDVSVQSSDWASATYVGMRHMLWFDSQPGAHLDDFIGALNEIDLPIPGHFVADIDLIERNTRADSVRLGIAALTISAA